MAENSYAEKEKLLLRKHELEWENLNARREMESARLRGSVFSGEMVAGFGPNPFDLEAAKLKEEHSRELLTLIEEKMAASAENKTKSPDAEPLPVSRTRKEAVLKILEEEGWSILDWANEAGVSHATAMDYLQEKTAPYQSTWLKLAKALGIPVEQLPK